MGKRYEQHSDMCGCERCAREYEKENPRPVFDVVEDPNYMTCGCYIYSNCTCEDDFYDKYEEE